MGETSTCIDPCECAWPIFQARAFLQMPNVRLSERHARALFSHLSLCMHFPYAFCMFSAEIHHASHFASVGFYEIIRSYAAVAELINSQCALLLTKSTKRTSCPLEVEGDFSSAFHTPETSAESGCARHATLILWGSKRLLQGFIFLKRKEMIDKSQGWLL